MYLKLGQSEVDFATLSSIWGHKNALSGTFLIKKSAMMTYGLIEGRGKVQITNTGRKLTQIPANPKELQEGLVEAIANIPLWKELYDRYTKSGKQIIASDFWIVLRQICHLTPEEAQSKAEIVRKAYLEDISGIESSNGGGSNMDENKGTEVENAGGDQTPKSPQISRELSFLTDGGVELKLLGVDAKEKWQRYKAVIDSYYGAEQTSG